MPVDFDNDILLLTCANGKQFSSDSSRQQLLEKYARKSKAHIEVVLADLAQPDDCKRILSGVTAVYHVGPSFHPRETEIGYHMIEAALTNKTKHFIYSSVLHPSLRKLLNHDCKRYIEEALIESGLPYTILQPSNFMDNAPIEKMLSEDKPVYPARWDPDVPFCHTSLHDLGEATSKILEQRESHFHATYQMVSVAPAIGYRDVCAIVSRVIDKEIVVEQMPFEKTMRREPPVETMFGLKENPHTRDVAQRILLYYNYRGLVGNTNVMRWVLGREPTSWEGWARGKMEDLKQT